MTTDRLDTLSKARRAIHRAIDAVNDTRDQDNRDRDDLLVTMLHFTADVLTEDIRS